MTAPVVGVVVVNYNGGELTLRCLRSLEAVDWPRDHLRIVLVDNASSDGVADRVERELPETEVVRSPVNLGFGGGCNAGIARLDGVDHVALLNNDAVAAPGWLAPLVHALERDPGLGAACSKILFDGRFVDVELAAPTFVPGRGDDRDLGVRVTGARVDGADVWGRAQLVEGFWGPERSSTADSLQWSAGRARLRLPAAGAGGGRAQLRLSAEADKRVVLTSGGERTEVTVTPEQQWVEVPFAAAPVEVIDNAGSVLVTGGYGADRGFLEADRGQYDTEDEVFAWCGAAVLLSARYLDEVGLFEPRFFLYYEDFDLAWRGQLEGWRYRYVPASVAHHVHTASTVEGSPLFRHHVERNRLLTLARNGPRALAARAAVHSAVVTLSYTRREVVSPLLHRRPVRPDIPRWRSRALVDFLRLLPWAVRTRGGIRRRRSVPDEDIRAWMVAGKDPVVGSEA